MLRLWALLSLTCYVGFGVWTGQCRSQRTGIWKLKQILGLGIVRLERNMALVTGTEENYLDTATCTSFCDNSCWVCSMCDMGT